jgi:hypothetical protein
MSGVVVERFDERQHLGSQQRAEQAADDEPHVLLERHGGPRVPSSRPQVKLEPGRVRGQLQHQVRVDAVAEEVEVDGEVHRMP